jgi:hypothetical protein
MFSLLLSSRSVNKLVDMGVGEDTVGDEIMKTMIGIVLCLAGCGHSGQQASDDGGKTMDTFTVTGSSIYVGDPTIGMVKYAIDLPAGEYTLSKWALVPSKGGDAIDTETMVIYVVDSSKGSEFEDAYHQIGNECDYNMMQMEQRHQEIERALGVRVGFYWVSELSGSGEEGTFQLDRTKIEKAP